MRSQSAGKDITEVPPWKTVTAVPVWGSKRTQSRAPYEAILRGRPPETAGVAADASRAAPSEPTGGREAAAPLYLSFTRCCDDGDLSVPKVKPNRTYWVIKPCHCRKWYCRDCAPWMGRSLRYRLRERLKQFRRVFGITLTIDGSLFESPEHAWRYVMDNRLLSQLVKRLHAAGCLTSRAYFWVVEFQGETQQAHWHLLVDADFVPFGKIVEVWSSFRPKWAPALAQKVTAENYRKLERPAFGSVWFSLTGTKDAWRAAAYATKYLVKTPSYGFPDWVLDYVGRVPRYGHSRGFFPDARPSVPAEDCEPSFDPERLERVPQTIRERIAQCKQQTTVLRVQVTTDEDGERFEGKPAFKARLKIPFHEACEALGVPAEECREVHIKFEGLLKLWCLEDRKVEASRCTDEFMEDDW